MSLSLVWEFIVPAGSRAAFERAYADDGDWAQLFRQAPGFLGTTLLADAEQDGRYLTIDRWESAAAFDAFKRDFGDAYRALDAALEGIAGRETRLGAFND